MTEGTSGMPMYTIRLASSSDGRSGGGPILTPSTCVTPLAAAMRSSEARSPAAMREPAGARRGAGVNAEAAIDSIIIFGLGVDQSLGGFGLSRRPEQGDFFGGPGTFSAPMERRGGQPPP